PDDRPDDAMGPGVMTHAKLHIARRHGRAQRDKPNDTRLRRRTALIPTRIAHVQRKVAEPGAIPAETTPARLLHLPYQRQRLARRRAAGHRCRGIRLSVPRLTAARTICRSRARPAQD